ncbi:hypothetical protein TNCV_3538591 [Trichonephila clavipes]|nr:hypothetical protein TNCV_3538591 [Trichonephila clavipes]
MGGGTPDRSPIHAYGSSSAVPGFGRLQTSFRGQLTCSRCASARYSSSDCNVEPNHVLTVHNPLGRNLNYVLNVKQNTNTRN